MVLCCITKLHKAGTELYRDLLSDTLTFSVHLCEIAFNRNAMARIVYKTKL